MFDNAQPQSGSSKLSGTGFINTVKTLKNPVAMFSGDADSIILNCYANCLILFIQRDLDLTGFFCVFDRIINQVCENLLNLVAVCLDAEVIAGGTHG